MPERGKVAVHFNFAHRLLSIREITRTGSLGRLIGTTDAITLEDCDFTIDKHRWRRWKDGLTPNVRQYAEIRGYLSRQKFDARAAGARSVRLDPHSRAEFFDAETGTVIQRANIVRIETKKIMALDTA